MYTVEKTSEGWQIKRGERVVACVPSEMAARDVALFLQNRFTTK